jgi:hypothetical protein
MKSSGLAGFPNSNAATQHSGLPWLPDNFKPINSFNPYADYHAPQ